MDMVVDLVKRFERNLVFLSPSRLKIKVVVVVCVYVCVCVCVCVRARDGGWGWGWGGLIHIQGRQLCQVVWPPF